MILQLIILILLSIACSNVTSFGVTVVVSSSRHRIRRGTSTTTSSSISRTKRTTTSINGAKSQNEYYHTTADKDHIEKVRNSMPTVVDGMPEYLDADKLQNEYFFLRHGQSTANVAEVISSSRSLAYSERHGLTELGYDQGFQSATKLLDVLEEQMSKKTAPQCQDTTTKNKKRLVFISSPFARARQTAEACLDGLLRRPTGAEEIEGRIQKLGLDVQDEVLIEDLLMERYFGRLDNEAIYTYSYVWPLDKFNVTHTAFDVESVAAVCHRWHDLIEKIESVFEDCYIVLTSHADVLQIGQLYAAHADNVGAFSSYRFTNGEVRPMAVAQPNTLPEPVPLAPPERGTSQYQNQQQQQQNQETSS